LVQNLVRKRNFNRIIFFDEDSLNFASDLLKTSTFNDPIYKIYTWEQKNKTLVWALKLETNVMLFLFIGMSFLVAICITSGFMIFFDKIKTDLISFWILGKSQKEVLNLSYVFTHMISFLFCSLGVMLGLGFLYFLKSNTISFMPDFFVERNIPVKIDTLKVLISFIIPYLISVVFSYFSFSLFKKDTSSFVKIIRNVG